ncbi:MAG: glycoside hydrolase family 57 protein [Bacteroidales bacterium]|nr:glycoside hydrolase family 57 protein [Bacteroidales bacterium]
MSLTGKKAICFYFQVHQPFRLKRYRFFDLGHDHYYYDDFTNESIMRKVADNCYLPANEIILDQILKNKGKFKVTYSLTGLVIKQFQLYAPEVLESFRKLAETGMVEFLAETESHSLVSIKTRSEFEHQVNDHREMIREFLGYETTSFRNTELIYSDQIGSWVADMGFKSMLTEGAKHVLGWKSPNFLYCNSINPRLKVLLRNFVLSDDIAFRFSNKGWAEWPLTTDKYTAWLSKIASKSELVNVFLDYETFGEHNHKDTGIFDFLEHLPSAILKKTPYKFMTPTEVASYLQPVSAISIPSPISWADEERDITAWHGNELQVAALEKLYNLTDKVNRCEDIQIKKDWKYLQASDHFYYMATKFFSDGAVHAYFNPYDTPYDAFMNYMNVLSDFEIRVNRFVPDRDTHTEISKLNDLIKEKESIIEQQTAQIDELRKKSGTKNKTAPATALFSGERTKSLTGRKTTSRKTSGKRKSSR